MSSRTKNEIYTCVGFLLLVLATGLYLVWYYYGLYPFIIGGIFVGLFAVWAVYNSRKTKKSKPTTTAKQPVQPMLNAFRNATPEERERMLDERGFTKYTDENGRTRWRVPSGLAG